VWLRIDEIRKIMASLILQARKLVVRRTAGKLKAKNI